MASQIIVDGKVYSVTRTGIGYTGRTTEDFYNTNPQLRGTLEEFTPEQADQLWYNMLDAGANRYEAFGNDFRGQTINEPNREKRFKKIESIIGRVPTGNLPTASQQRDLSSGGTTTGSSGTSSSSFTSNFKNSSAYKALSADERELVDLAFSTFNGTEEEQRIFSDALRQATEMADPYAKAQLNLFRGEFESQIAFLKGDLERASEIITRTRDELAQDVSAAKEFLSLEQQADIAQQTTRYEEDLLSIADQAAEKGLTFATGARSRSLSEERRGAQYQDVIQSGRREFNFRTKELELKASRGDIDAQAKLADMRAKSSFQLEDIGRSAEKVLGSASVPGGTGYTPSGGVLGSIEQERRGSILGLAKLGLPA